MKLSTSIASVTLPWPSSDLSPNSRLHWARKSRVAKKTRNDARLLCLAEGIRGLGWDRARVSVTFYAPDNRRRDSDNLLSSLKSALDGIADATGIDDALWSISISRGPIRPGGQVVVRLSPIWEEADDAGC